MLQSYSLTSYMLSVKIHSMPVIDHDTWRPDLTAGEIQRLTERGTLPPHFEYQVRRTEEVLEKSPFLAIPGDAKKEAFQRALWVASRYGGITQGDAQRESAQAMEAFVSGFQDGANVRVLPEITHRGNIEEVLRRIPIHGRGGDHWAVMGYMTARMLNQPEAQHFTGIAWVVAEEQAQHLMPIDSTFANWPFGDMIRSLSSALFYRRIDGLEPVRGDQTYMRNWADAEARIRAMLEPRVATRLREHIENKTASSM